MVTLKINYPSYSLKRNYSFTALIPIEQNPMTKEITAPEDGGFKTLYLLHGFGGDCNDWILNTRIFSYAEEHKIAIIMPSGENSFYLDNSYSEERYSNYVSKELIEITRALFPLSDKREDTSIGGLSMGGFGAICNGLHNPGVFGSIIAMSSALITEKVAAMTPEYSDFMAGYPYYEYIFGKPEKVLKSQADPKYLAEQLAKSGEAIPNIYLACGREDFTLEANRSFEQHLTRLGIEHTYVEDDGNHDWNFWDKYIQKALEWLSR